MAVRTPLSEVLTTNISQPTSSDTVFLASDKGTEGYLTAAAAISLLGTQGVKGDQGIPGFTGSTGTMGQTGFVGSVGYTGSTGTMGIAGYTGSTGTQGITGFTGSTGTRGITGFTGSTGTRGEVGFTGSTGTQGLAGNPGQGVPVGGTTGQILTKLSNNDYDTYWKNSEGGLSNTTTNVAGGRAGSIPIQYNSSLTTFINGGNTGDLLQYNTATSTATWASTSTLFVGRAKQSDTEYINLLGSAEGTPKQYLTMVSGSANYYNVGVNADIFYHTNNKILTSPSVNVSATTSATNTFTGALTVQGGVGIGGSVYVEKNLNVSGIITAKQLTIQYTTITYSATVIDDITTITTTTNATDSQSGALVVAGGVGIGKDLYVGGVIYGTFNGGIALATNLAGGTAGQIPFQSDVSTTLFAGPGTAGQILVSTGANTIGPAFRSTNTFRVGFATSLSGGSTWSLPYQLVRDNTQFLPIGTTGYVLTSNGTTFSWQPASNSTSAKATTATNLDLGTAGQVPYQNSPGRTLFFGPGQSGQLLMSSGPTAPGYVNTTSIYVGRALLADSAINIVGGDVGSIPYQSAAGKTSFIPVGTNGFVLTSDGTTATWKVINVASAGSSNNLTGGSAGQLHIQSGSGATSFVVAGNTGNILQYNATNNTATWISTSTLLVGNSLYSNTTTNATNIVGGALGSIHIQSASGKTSFIPMGAGTNGYVLTSDGTTATWKSITSTTVDYANTASNISGGGAGRLVYNYGVGQTGFTNAGTAGQILISGGTGSPVWTTTATIGSGGTGGTGILLVQGDINATKEITAYASSDSRLKENVTIIENALEKIRTLNGVMFDWKESVIEEKGGEDGYFIRKHDTGIIAQDVEKVLPEVVATRDDGFLAVRYEKMAGLIIQAINELANEVDELKKRIQ